MKYLIKLFKESLPFAPNVLFGFLILASCCEFSNDSKACSVAGDLFLSKAVLDPPFDDGEIPAKSNSLVKYIYLLQILVKINHYQLTKSL